MNETNQVSTIAPVKRKTDRRVNRTRRLLRDSLFSLILEKGYESVTVEEITRRADLGRTTFYLHYRDKEDLLMESIGELVDDLISQMTALSPLLWGGDKGGAGSLAGPVISLPFQHVARNADLYRIILRGEGTYSATLRLREIINQAAAELIQIFVDHNNLRVNPQVPMEVFLNNLAGSWLAMIGWWLESDMPYTPDEMAVMFQKLFIHGPLDVLGIGPK